MHFNSSQSRSAWTEQEDDLLRNAVGIYGERSWANVAQMVPGRSSKSCSDRWRNFLSPDIEHPRKSPFTEWEIAVVVLAQARYGNNWKAISMLLPGRTNRAVKNLFVGNLKWGARLPEIRNRFLEWGMTLESLLEIKPDRAGGPVKPRPGQVLPDGTNGTSLDGSPLSGSPASTSSAGSAWQSDMTEHPNGSPGSANTSERRRRADGEMAAHAGQQSSPVHKRRRGAQSPVLGGLQHHAQSPSLAPHPGALGPSFNGVSGSGSPMGLVIPGTMGPPANRHPSAFVNMDPSSNLMLTKQPGGSSNGSNDGTSALLMPPGSETTPTSDLTGSENCATLTPGGALTATLAGGCFGSNAAAMGMGVGQPGPRTHSMPCGGLQQLLLSDGGMASRATSWHFGQMYAVGGGGLMDPAAAAAMAAARSASPFQQQLVQASAVAAAGVPGSLTSLLTDSSDTGAVDGAADAAAAAAAGYQMHAQQQLWMHQQHYQQQQRLAAQHAQLQFHHQQQMQQQQHHLHQQHLQQQQMGGGTHAGHDPSAAAAAAAGPADFSAMQQQQHQQQQQQQQQLGSQLLQPNGHCHGHGQHEATTASIVASAAMELPLPSSPILAGNILQDMRSNDSAGLHSMLDQILNEDLTMADSTLALLGGGSDGIPIAPQRSSAFDPPVITLPSLPDAPPCQGDGGTSPSPRPQAPPPTPVGQGNLCGPGMMGQGIGSSGPGHMGQAGSSGPGHMGQAGSSGPDAMGQAGSSRPGSCSHMGGAQLWGGEFAGMQSGTGGDGGMQGSACAANASGFGHSQNPMCLSPLGIKTEPQQGQQTHHQLGGSMGGVSAAADTAAAMQPSHQPSQQQQQQQQPQQPSQPPRPGSSAGMSGQQASSPEPPAMSMLCAQLQQENLLLMHKLHQMEAHMAGSKPSHAAAAPGMQGSDGAGAGAMQATQAAPAAPEQASMGAHGGPAAAAASTPSSVPQQGHVQHQQGGHCMQSAAATSAHWSSFDALMPQLRPVLTRVGGSAGGALSAGGSLGGMCPASDLVVESPAQLINTAFLEEHGLLGDL